MTDLETRNALAREIREIIEGKKLGAQIADLVDWLLLHDGFASSRQTVADESVDAWRKLIHGEDHEALLRVRAEIDDMYSTSDISQGVRDALIARIDGRPTESDLTEEFFAEQDRDV
jgi:hydrogenase maturation factor